MSVLRAPVPIWLARGRVRLAGVAMVGLCLLPAVAGAAQARVAHELKAVLHVARLKPFTVKAVGFKPSEAVVVKVTGAATGSAKGVASATGSLTVTLPKVTTLTTCSAYSVRATGAKGSVATFKSVVAPACRPIATIDFGASVIVTGSHFKPGERLTVTLIADGTRTRSIGATAKGLLTVSFGALPLSNCSAYTLKITGSMGSTFKKSQAAVPC
jgi:hypothetical protein